jgi:hypothetical protein
MQSTSDQSQLNADQSVDQPPINRRFNVHEAASILGITPEAVRARIQRGTLTKEKDADGAVYVRLNADQLQPSGDETNSGSRSDADQTDAESSSEPADPALVEALQERIEYLTKIIDTRDEEIRRRDTIIMTLSQRIPELEAPASPDQASWHSLEPRESPVAASEESGNGTTAEEYQEGSQERRSWLYRFFFGP